MPCTAHHKFAPVHIGVERTIEVDGVVLLVADVVVVVIMVEAINLCRDACMGKGWGELVDERSLLGPGHVEAGTIALIERLILRRDGINGDALGLECLDETHKIVGVCLVMVGIERAARPRIVANAVGEALHLHPLRARPRRSHYLEVRIDGKNLLEDGDDELRLVRVQTEVLKPRLVAERILGAGEVAAANADAGIAHAVALGGRIGSRQEGTAVGGRHLQQVVARAVGDGISEAVHRLIGRGWLERDVSGISGAGALCQGVLHLLRAVGRGRIDVHLFGKEGKGEEEAKQAASEPPPTEGGFVVT